MSRIGRRAALKAGAITLAAAASRPAAASSPGWAWVLLLLSGGPDALSFVVPHSAGLLPRARPKLYPATSYCGLDAQRRMHTALSPLSPLERVGELAMVAGFGQARLRAAHPAARAQLLGELTKALGHTPVEFRANSPRRALLEVAAAIGAGSAPPFCLVEWPGWDTHAAQVSTLSVLLSELSGALLDYRAALGSAFERSRCVVAGEFGRRLRENGSAGTDDGGAGIALVLAPASALGLAELPQGLPAFTREFLEQHDQLPVTLTPSSLVQRFAVRTREPLK